jgi:hypothetical protein
VCVVGFLTSFIYFFTLSVRYCNCLVRANIIGTVWMGKAIKFINNQGKLIFFALIISMQDTPEYQV